MNSFISKKLTTLFSDITVSIPEDNRMVIETASGSVISVLSFLKSSGYEHLALISCVDWIKQGQLELVYIVSGYIEDVEESGDKGKTNILVKTRIPREKPQFMTVLNVFDNAEPYERELHELFGINFEGHPRLTPLFLERNYEIPPFRKDFDTREYVKKVFDKIPPVKDE